MLAALYLFLLLFLLHSALLMASDAIMILVIFLVFLALCSFLLCFIQRYLTEAVLYADDGNVSLKVYKKGFLPLPGMKLTLKFGYHQTEEGAESSTTAAIPCGETEIRFPVSLPYSGSGRFELKKCAICDFLGFLH